MVREVGFAPLEWGTGDIPDPQTDRSVWAETTPDRESLTPRFALGREVGFAPLEWGTGDAERVLHEHLQASRLTPPLLSLNYEECSCVERLD